MQKNYPTYLRRQLLGCTLKLYFSVIIFCFAYDTVSGQPSDFRVIDWSVAAPQTYPVSEAQGKVVNNKLYCFGGFDSQKPGFTPTKRSYVYDPVADSWSAIADLPHTPNGVSFGGITHAGIATDSTDIYIAGGYTANSAGTGQFFGTKQVWKYSPVQNIYTQLPDLPVSISAGQLEYLDGKLHYIGGTDSLRTMDLGNHYVLDLSNLPAGWDTLALLPNPRHHAASVVFGGKIYFIGGQHGHDEALTAQKDVHVFDPANNSWAKVASLRVPAGADGRGHISSAGAVMDNRILLLGGETAHQNSINLVSAYTPATNSWADLTPLPQSRYSGVAGVMNGNIFYTGGSASSTTYKGIPDTLASSNALLFVENLDRFPSNEHFVFSKVQIPWSRDTVNYNTNHDSVTVRIRNKGFGILAVNNLILTNDTTWNIIMLKGVEYVPDSALPFNIAPGAFADVTLKFVAADAGSRVRVLRDTLTIISNDDKFPSKPVYLSGIWQRQGEGNNEPYATEIINAFGFKTSTGFGHTDPDEGDTAKLKGDEIISPYFLRADTTRPIRIRQMSSYHGCCLQTEKIAWYAKGVDTFRTVLTHLAKDAQSVLPRKNLSASPAEATFTPPGAFGFRIGFTDNTNALENPGGKIGVRVWKAFDSKDNIIPNSYIFSNDYLGGGSTNYDYNDNTYFISNIKPEIGSAFFSSLSSAPSALDFGEKITASQSSLRLNLSSLGQVYADSSRDPVIAISSLAITGENASEFSALLPVKRNLSPQDTTSLAVNFNPVSQGLKIADLLIYYNNSLSPLRVPLYGIAKSTDSVIVTAHYRINSGSATPVTINGKTWSADNQYAFDNIEPYNNPLLTQIAATDEDSLYLKEQSSNGDKRPFRYQLPLDNGEYVVRLHFAEIYWGAPGSGLTGGAGSRVMNISLENQLRLANFDVTQEVGGASAIVKNFPVTVADSQLNINFSANVNRPMVVAVEVYSLRPSNLLSSEVIPVEIISNADDKLQKPVVYPNPLQNRFRIKFPGKYSGYSTLQIADVSGRVYELGKVKLQRGRPSIAEINISGLSLKPGFYYLRIISESRSADVIKLIIR